MGRFGVRLVVVLAVGGVLSGCVPLGASRPRSEPGLAPSVGSTLQSRRAAVAGTPFAMVVPAGWVAAKRFDGFSGPEDHGRIDFIALPIPAEAAARYLDAEGLRARGMALIKNERVRVSGADVELGLISEQIAGVEYEEWVMIFPAGPSSFLCSAAYWRSERERWQAPLKASLLSAEYEPTSWHPRSPLFHVNVPELKRAGNLARAEIYTVDGEIHQESAAAPVLVVAPSLAHCAVADREAYAEQVLERMQGTTLARVVERNLCFVDGLGGFEHVATGTDRDGTPVTIYQCILFTDDDYFLIRGSVGRQEAARYLPLFKQAAHSFRRAPAN